MGEELHIKLPDAPETPDFGPQISELRERVARAEAHLEHIPSGEAASESLSLASEAHRLAAEALAKVEALASAAESVPAQVESQVESAVQELEPPPPPAPDPSLEQQQPEVQETHAPHHPWWHPERWF